DGYLPYEGRVVLQNKSARTVSVRFPHWVTPRTVRCQLNDRAVDPLRVGNRLLFTSLRGNERITVEFPVTTVKTTFTLASVEYARGREKIPRTEFTGTFRANTLLDVSPLVYNPCLPHPCYPIYQRDHLKAAKAPLVKSTRYVAPFHITW
ncbi:MAG: hypothetical protein HY646_20350, partial [Acidobacteria bacterium]|nr:hypothetical protein [Acidobacteriota bacterium]